MHTQAITIMVGADTVPTPSNEALLRTADGAQVFGDLAEAFRRSDLNVINLECPLTTSGTPIEKFGPAFKGHPETAIGLKAAGVSVCALANNHILDYGEQGLSDTIEALTKHGLDWFGAGRSVEEARRIKYILIKEKRIALIAVAEQEFSNATDTSGGANPFDVFNTMDDIQEARGQADAVIVFYHGGKEQCRYPSPRLQRVCRRMVDCGADYVICQHSHCIGSYERYGSGHIVYGQGNLLFDYKSDHPHWQEGLLLELGIGCEGEAPALNFIPVVKDGHKVRMANPEEADAILEPFRSRSAEILDPAVVEQRFQAFCEEAKVGYFSGLSQLPGVVRKIDRKLLNNWIVRRIFTHRRRRRLHHYIKCEAHHDVMDMILQK
jgi:poly-gamma-glutamate capsule biosynthesis protein CapA/YwtB (metallophosphatase superfamily)